MLQGESFEEQENEWKFKEQLDLHLIGLTWASYLGLAESATRPTFNLTSGNLLVNLCGTLFVLSYEW